MIECPKCKWTNQDDAVRCANCSAELRAQQAPPPQPPQQQPGATPGQQYPPQQPYGQQPGYQQFAPGTMQTVPDNLIWSILVTIFCCLIPGIVAIVKAAEANSKKAVGDYYGAMAAYNASKTWMYWAIGLGVIQQVVGAIYVFAMMSTMHRMHP